MIVPDGAAHNLRSITRTFAACVSTEGIEIALSDEGLTPAEVRQYLRLVEGNLELAGDGLELQISVKGPRR